MCGSDFPQAELNNLLISKLEQIKGNGDNGSKFSTTLRICIYLRVKLGMQDKKDIICHLEPGEKIDDLWSSELYWLPVPCIIKSE